VRGAGISGRGGVLMQHTFVIAETEYEAWLSRRGEGYALHVGGHGIPVALAPAEGGGQLLCVGGETSRVLIAPDGDFVHVHLDGATFTIRYVDAVQRYGSHAGGGADDIAEAPMPGVVIAVHVKEGQPVAAGDTLMVIESMKLETAIKAWREGAVAAVHVGVGQAFQRGAPLLSLAPQSGA
jgi:3-methylcrotonyl-CoA carboxylase alpha subunit